MLTEKEQLNGLWILGILLAVVLFIFGNFIVYGCPITYDNVIDYEIMYDSVIVRVETSRNELETMAFNSEDVYCTDSGRIYINIHRCLFLNDALICLPKDEYVAYRDILFKEKGE